MVNVDPSRSFGIVGSSMLFENGREKGICKLNARAPDPRSILPFDNECGVIHVIAVTFPPYGNFLAGAYTRILALAM